MDQNQMQETASQLAMEEYKKEMMIKISDTIRSFVSWSAEFNAYHVRISFRLWKSRCGPAILGTTFSTGQIIEINSLLYLIFSSFDLFIAWFSSYFPFSQNLCQLQFSQIMYDGNKISTTCIVTCVL
jgi:hypothetical protein